MNLQLNNNDVVDVDTRDDDDADDAR